MKRSAIEVIVCTASDLDLFGGCLMMEEPHTERSRSFTHGFVMDYVLGATDWKSPGTYVFLIEMFYHNKAKNASRPRRR